MRLFSCSGSCAMGQGQRFLERPNLLRAVLLGLAVGMSQLFKYNGWTSGIIVAVERGSLAAWPIVASRQIGRGRDLGLGILAAIVAAAVYWPWFAFVESHGGYRRSWHTSEVTWAGFRPGRGIFRFRLAGHDASWRASVARWCAASQRALGMSISRGFRLRPSTCRADRWLSDLLSRLCARFRVSRGGSLWRGVGLCFCGQNGLANKSALLVCVGWVTLSVLTPFYHPYARLWLPVEAFGGCSWRAIRRDSIDESKFTGTRSPMEMELRVRSLSVGLFSFASAARS